MKRYVMFTFVGVTLLSLSIVSASRGAVPFVEVEVKGVSLEFPRLERLNVASLPGLGGFEKRLAVIGPAIKMLSILSANTVVIEKDGKMRLLYKGDEGI